jgi:hypothetical protein
VVLLFIGFQLAVREAPMAVQLKPAAQRGA